MFANKLISYSVPPLKMSDTAEKALAWMSDFHVRHLPVVGDNKQLLGILSEDEVLNMEDPDLDLAANEAELTQQFAYENQHLYDVMKLIVDNNLTVVPVLNIDHEYLGIITMENLIKHVADSGAIAQPGGILVLEILPRDYSLAEIARLVESEKALILSSFISSPYGKEQLEVTLKLNKQDLKHVIATLERFNYTVKASFHATDTLDTLKEHYDLLMKYINM
jgi:acetoin utilization protein AcuB